MGKKKKELPSIEDNTEAIGEAIVLSETALVNLCKGGRKRWTRKPKALVNQDLMGIAAGLRLLGMSWEGIAKQLNKPVGSVQNYMNHDRYKKIYAEMLSIYREQLQNRLLSLVPTALTTLQNLMADSDSGHVRYEAANSIIEKAEKLMTTTNDKDLVTDYREALDELRKKAKRPDVQVNVGIMQAGTQPPLIQVIEAAPA